MKTKDFGISNSSNKHYYEANFKGPLVPLKPIDKNIIQLVATSSRIIRLSSTYRI